MYLAFLHEDETKFPTEEYICWTLSKKPHFEIKELLKRIRKRFSMCFGVCDLAEVRAFFDGYFLCKNDYKIPSDTFDLKIKSFIESIVCEALNLTGEFVTWDRNTLTAEVGELGMR